MKVLDREEVAKVRFVSSCSCGIWTEIVAVS
jgi:hypothetical protein